MNLSERVKRRRLELRMTQDELATKMGYASRTSINKVECGREVGNKIIARLAEALDVSVPYLMGFDISPEEQAEQDASILMDDDLMEFVQEWRKLDKEQQASLIQTAKMMSKYNSAP